jgi:hypothetical protein
VKILYEVLSFLFLSHTFSRNKVKKIEEDSLYSIPSPSPSVKIIRGKGFFKSLFSTPSNVLPLHLKQTFLPIIGSLTQGCCLPCVAALRNQFEFSLKVKVMGSNPGYLLKSFLLYKAVHCIRQ